MNEKHRCFFYILFYFVVFEIFAQIIKPMIIVESNFKNKSLGYLKRNFKLFSISKVDLFENRL